MKTGLDSRFATLLGATILAMGAANSAYAQAGGATAGADDQVTSTSDIIVTAQRREERIQDVPIAITAFSSERLQQQGISDAQGLQATVPSLVVGAVGQQSRDVQSITLRGQGASFQASPGVVVYLNEVPLPAPASRSLQGGPGNFLDLENVQVLAGPQGTLFGRNTTGGAVLLTPKKPDDSFGGWLQGRIGNYDRRELEGALNVPIVGEKLAVRVAGAYHDRDGFTYDRVWDKDRDDEHWYSGRVGIIARPVDGVENYLMIYGAKSSNNGAGVISGGFNIPFLAGSGLCAQQPVSAVGAFSCDVYQAAAAQDSPRVTNLDNDVFSMLKTWGVVNTTDVDLTDSLKLRNIISYHRLKTAYALDWDGTVLQQQNASPFDQPVPGQVTLPLAGTPITYLNPAPIRGLAENLKLFTEELELQGNALDGNLTFTLGGFYSKQSPGPTIPSQGNLFCPAAYTGLCPVTVGGNVLLTQKSQALYGQGTFDFAALSESLSSLRLTLGYRKTWDTITGISSDPVPPSSQIKSSAPSWLVGVDYRPVQDLLLFGKISRGYKSGGYNGSAVYAETATFGPERVLNYEAGFKSDLNVGIPLRVNGTYYFLKYKGIQKATADFNITTNDFGARVVNADAQIQGLEGEVSLQPFKGLEIGGNFSWTDAKYKNFSFVVTSPFGQPDCSGVAAMGATANLTCLPFNGVAKYIWSLHASAERGLGEGMGSVALFMSYSHTSSIPTAAVASEAVEPGSRLEGFGLLNASLDWKSVAGSNFDVGLFVTNATNKLYRISNNNVYSVLGHRASLYGEPRMYGLRLKFGFGSR